MSLAMTARALTEGEIRLAASIFGDAIDYRDAAVSHSKWAFFQPKNTTMAPMGTIHFHPEGGLYRDDFAAAPLGLQALFVHEMVHVWQAQTRGRWWLPLMRHPFCRYRYAFEPGRPFDRYGIEQQAELIRHLFLAREGAPVPGAPPRDALEAVSPFRA